MANPYLTRPRLSLVDIGFQEIKPTAPPFSLQDAQSVTDFEDNVPQIVRYAVLVKNIIANSDIGKFLSVDLDLAKQTLSVTESRLFKPTQVIKIDLINFEQNDFNKLRNFYEHIQKPCFLEIAEFGGSIIKCFCNGENYIAKYWDPSLGRVKRRKMRKLGQIIRVFAMFSGVVGMAVAAIL